MNCCTNAIRTTGRLDVGRDETTHNDKTRHARRDGTRLVQLHSFSPQGTAIADGEGVGYKDVSLAVWAGLIPARPVSVAKRRSLIVTDAVSP